MAKLYGEIASSALMSFDKSFDRLHGQPLDGSEVYYSLDAAKRYATTAQAYVGQKIVVIENGVVSHYSIEDAAGTLKELGSKPVADGTTVSIAEDGKITLANITDAEKTGTYNAVLVNGALTWVKPSSTTVEGLSDLIEALTGRVDTAEADIDALQASVGVASKAAVGEEGSEDYEPAVAATGLHKAVEDEIARAEAAEKALGERIDAIDFVDENELAEALASKVNIDDYAVDKKAFEDEDKAIRAIAEDAQSKIDTFLNSEEIDETVNTLREIQEEIAKMTDATELELALASKADLTYVNEELGKKQDVIAEGTYATPDDVATAKDEAIDAAATAAAGIYATQTALGNLETAIDERLDALEEHDHSTYVTNNVFEEYKTEVSNTYAIQTVVNEISQVANNAAAKVDTLEDKVEEITSVGGEPNVIDYIKVNGSILEVEKDAEGKSTKTVNIAVPTALSQLAGYTDIDNRITTADGTANTALANANQAQTDVNTLKATVNEHGTTISDLVTSVNGHGQEIAALKQADIAHASDYNTLYGIVSGHTGAIAQKADITALDAVSAKASANEANISTINNTIDSINAEIAKKANASDVYTKAKIGEIEENKTLIEMVEDSIASAVQAGAYDDSTIKALIKDNTDAIAILNGDASTAGSVIAIANAQAKAEVAAIVGAAPEAMDTLEEVANWIANDETGAAAMAKSIADNKTAIDAINNETTGILAVAEKYTDDSIANLPLATGDVVGLVKVDNKTIQADAEGTISVKAVSTDLLVQGSQELVLDGGNAGVPAAE